MNPTLGSPRIFTLLSSLSLLAVTQFGFAQEGKYKPGEKIEYRESIYSEVWETGTYVSATPDGKQPIIRKKPNEFYKDGAQTAWDWERLRPLNSQPTAKAPATVPSGTQASPVTTPSSTPPPKTVATAPAAPAPATSTQPAPSLPASSGLLTMDDILNFLRTRLGDQPFAHPQREQIKKELAELIKRRGVNFRYEAVSEFSNQLGKYGASSDITFPIQSNYGAPTEQRWLIGKWSLSKIGATVDRDGKDGYIYRQTEIGVKDVGSVNVNADGTFLWNVDVPRAVVHGQWRKATAEEMRHQGGDGIVLLKAKGGVDWIVHQDRVTPLKGDWVNIAQLDYRQVREGGFRGK